ncbi:hypothetical protein DKX38_008986 [Salix brachista]|uniref:Uncharacterized protein n=1 Tax=Salix brachista TaxID=2182728 RepID=A0A5N5M9D4_9ROSI|nr:hypothetical protein DKX38_008986 [Salix brachista]
MNMKVQILSRKLIAPSSPTPPNLQNLKISCFDQLAPPTYVPFIFYYPVSGEDHGEYLEAQVSGSLSQLLGREEFKTEMWWRLVPQVFRPENNPPLTIQFNRFECGGVAIGSCVAHRIADAYTVGTFINTWAAACRMGIGKPSWVQGVDAAASPGTVTLMDTEDGGGIEAFLGICTALSSDVEISAPVFRELGEPGT